MVPATPSARLRSGNSSIATFREEKRSRAKEVPGFSSLGGFFRVGNRPNEGTGEMTRIAVRASWIGILAVCAAPLLMLVAYVLQGVGPDGPGGVAASLVRIVVAGLLLALLYTAVGLGVSSLTDRKAFATAALLLLMVVASSFVTVLVDETGLPGSLQGLSLLSGPFGLVELVHGERASIPGLGLPAALGGLAAWTALGLAVTRTRYRLLQVTR